MSLRVELLVIANARQARTKTLHAAVCFFRDFLDKQSFIDGEGYMYEHLRKETADLS